MNAGPTGDERTALRNELINIPSGPLFTLPLINVFDKNYAGLHIEYIAGLRNYMTNLWFLFTSSYIRSAYRESTTNSILDRVRGEAVCGYVMNNYRWSGGIAPPILTFKSLANNVLTSSSNIQKYFIVLTQFIFYILYVSRKQTANFALFDTR